LPSPVSDRDVVRCQGYLWSWKLIWDPDAVPNRGVAELSEILERGHWRFPGPNNGDSNTYFYRMRLPYKSAGQLPISRLEAEAFR